MFKTLLTKLPPHVVRLLLAMLICMPVWGSYAKAQTVEPYAVYDVSLARLHLSVMMPGPEMPIH